MLAVTILVWIFPQEGKFKYEFSKGKPWLHEDLYAPFDFAITKLDEDIEKEKLEAVQGLPYYFRYVPSDSIDIANLIEPEFIRQWEAAVPDTIDNVAYRQKNTAFFLI